MHPPPSFDPRAAQPSLQTPRLLLRALCDTDAEPIRRYAGDRRIAAMTLTLPHPYEAPAARAFIAAQREDYVRGLGVTFALERRSAGDLIGVVGLRANPEHEHAEIGYWVGVPFWSRGYATEAARAVVDFAFEVRGYHRVFGRVYCGNRASERILERLGMRHEGCLREHLLRFGERQDVTCFGLLRRDWQAARAQP